MSDDEPFGTQWFTPIPCSRRMQHIYVLQDERQVNGMQALFISARARVNLAPVTHLELTCLHDRPGFVSNFMREGFPLFRDVDSITIMECTIRATDLVALARALLNHPRPISVFDFQRINCTVIMDCSHAKEKAAFIRALRLNPRLCAKNCTWWFYEFKQNDYPYLYAQAMRAAPSMLDLLDLLD